MNITSQEVQFKEIDFLDIKGRGIYAWFVQLPNEMVFKNRRRFHFEKLVNLFDRRIDISGTSFLQNYEGFLDLIKLKDLDNINFEDDSFYELLRNSIKLLCPPIYIGKTKNDVSLRLKKHANILKNISVSNLDEEDLDFKNQLMTRIQEKGIDQSWLYVKVLAINEPDSFPSRIELDVERLINRIFHPILSRN